LENSKAVIKNTKIKLCHGAFGAQAQNLKQNQKLSNDIFEILQISIHMKLLKAFIPNYYKRLEQYIYLSSTASAIVKVAQQQSSINLLDVV
jgi:hypothetical protein